MDYVCDVKEKGRMGCTRRLDNPAPRPFPGSPQPAALPSSFRAGESIDQRMNCCARCTMISTACPVFLGLNKRTLSATFYRNDTR